MISFKNETSKYFLWCYIRHLHLLETHSAKIMLVDRRMVNGLDYDDINFLFLKRNKARLNKKNNICTNEFGYENRLVFPVHVSDEQFGDTMGLSLITGDSKLHYVYIKDVNKFMCNKAKHKGKNIFGDIFFSALVVKKSS